MSGNFLAKPGRKLGRWGTIYLMGKGGTSLAEFAAANPQRSDGGCSICRLDQVDEIDAFYREAGPKHATITKWLHERGIGISKTRVMSHYQAGHYVEGYRDRA